MTSKNENEESVGRRDFLKTTAATAGAMALAPHLGAMTRSSAAAARRRGGATPGKVMVVIFQFGGADSLSLVAPVFNGTYKNILRPNLRVGEPGEGTALDGLPMDSTFAMYPHMAGLHALWQSGDLAVVHAAGYMPPDRSHFLSQDIYQKGTVTDVLTAEGWCNLYGQQTATGPGDALVRVLGIGSQSSPTCFQGKFPTYSVGSVAELSFQASSPDIEPALEGILAAVPGATKTETDLHGGTRDALDLIDHFSGVDPATYVPDNGATYPQSPLGASLAEVAQIIKAGLGVELFHVPIGGWDHHSNLPNVLPGLANTFSDAIAAFVQDLGPASMQDVVVVTMSEFGREAGENASSGFDHGHGGAMMLVGGGVQGGQVHGTWPGVDLADLDQGRFLSPVNDFRNVLGDVLVGHMGLTAADVSTVFNGHTYAPIGVI